MTTRTIDEDLAAAREEMTHEETTDRMSAIGGAMSDAAGTVRNAASDAVSRLPEVASTTRSALDEANRRMRGGSDELLSAGSALSIGVAMGLLLSGASRVLVIGAVVPAGLMTLTMLDRSGKTRAGGRRLQGS